MAAQRVYNKYKLLDLAAQIATGDIWEQRMKRGQLIAGPTANSDRIAAIKYIDERAWGKVPQAVTGPDGGPVRLELVNGPDL